MENLTLTKAEQSLIERVNKHGGIAKYKSWISNNIHDRRYRFTYFKNLENLRKKLQANNALHLLKP
jgi:hypothetical protein